MRGFLVLYAVALVFFGFAAFSDKGVHEVDLAASRLLPAGHLVEAGDLTLAPDKTLYLPRSVEAGETVRFDELLAAPLYRHRQGYVPLSLEIEQSNVVGLTGSNTKSLWLCPAELETFFVAEYCTPEASSCLVVIDIKQDDLQTAKETEGLFLSPNACE